MKILLKWFLHRSSFTLIIVLNLYHQSAFLPVLQEVIMIVTYSLGKKGVILMSLP